MIDMSAAAVTERLRALGRFDVSCRPPRMPMDASSVTQRLKSMAELSELCIRLAAHRGPTTSCPENDVSRQEPSALNGQPSAKHARSTDS